MNNIRKAFDILGAALVLLTCLSVLYNWDPTRIYVKRFKAADQYLYDDIRPELRDVDPASFITIRNDADAQAARKRLIDVIWGEPGSPLDSLPDQVSLDVKMPHCLSPNVMPWSMNTQFFDFGANWAGIKVGEILPESMN